MDATYTQKTIYWDRRTKLLCYPCTLHFLNIVLTVNMEDLFIIWGLPASWIYASTFVQRVTDSAYCSVAFCLRILCCLMYKHQHFLINDENYEQAFTTCHVNILATDDLRKHNRGRPEGLRLLGRFRKKGEVKLKFILKKYGMNMRTGFRWLRIRSSDELVRTR